MIDISMDEGIIMAIYRADSKSESIKKMQFTLPAVADDQEVTQLITTVMRKMEEMSDEEYNNKELDQYQQILDLADDDDNEEKERGE